MCGASKRAVGGLGVKRSEWEPVGGLRRRFGPRKWASPDEASSGAIGRVAVGENAGQRCWIVPYGETFWLGGRGCGGLALQTPKIWVADVTQRATNALLPSFWGVSDPCFAGP